MARRPTKDKTPKVEAPRLVMEGGTFTAHHGLAEVSAAIYNVDGFGPRILPVTFNPGGTPTPPSVKNCLHGRPIFPMASKFGGVDVGNTAGYAELCRLCGFEVDTIRARRSLP
jgi:hypothetical protein